LAALSVQGRPKLIDQETFIGPTGVEPFGTVTVQVKRKVASPGPGVACVPSGFIKDAGKD
jgi:hypothetical protein